jgi:small subunit ribosomal protein S16
MKRIGRKHRPFFRICATDSRAPRDGRVIETLGTYDPLVADTDARVTLNNDRVDYWLSVGALPSDRVKVLIKKYGTKGKRSAEHKAAREKLVIERSRRQAAAGKAAAVNAAPAEAESAEE